MASTEDTEMFSNTRENFPREVNALKPAANNLQHRSSIRENTMRYIEITNVSTRGICIVNRATYSLHGVELF